MRRRSLPIVIALSLLLIASASHATLIGDSVEGCFVDPAAGIPCSAGFSGSFTSTPGTVSESTVEFTGTDGGFTVTADFLTFGGDMVIRLTLADPGNIDPTLMAGYTFGFYDLGWTTSETLSGAHTDTTFQFAQIDAWADVSQCGGDPTCEAVIGQLAADAKADSIVPVNTITTTSDSIVITLGAISTGAFEPLSIDIVLETAVPEPSTALLLTFGLAGLASWRRRLH
ncbi:MAG: PEP-CTERM sorting domain-containing protein [bacterium]|nr:PEP-CTERM sorting domain-containing protein [bacterium]